MDYLVGRIKDSLLVGGRGRNIFSIVYSNASAEGAKPCKRVQRYAQPDFFLKKCAIGCILGPILASIALLFLRLLKFADKSEKRILNVI